MTQKFQKAQGKSVTEAEAGAATCPGHPWPVVSKWPTHGPLGAGSGAAPTPRGQRGTHSTKQVKAPGLQRDGLAYLGSGVTIGLSAT